MKTFEELAAQQDRTVEDVMREDLSASNIKPPDPHKDKTFIKVLMMLGSAKSSVKAITIARHTGLRVSEVDKALEKGIEYRVIFELADSNEYYAGSGDVFNLFQGRL